MIRLISIAIKCRIFLHTALWYILMQVTVHYVAPSYQLTSLNTHTFLRPSKVFYLDNLAAEHPISFISPLFMVRQGPVTLAWQHNTFFLPLLDQSCSCHT